MAIDIPPNSLVPPPQGPAMANAEVLKDTNRAILKLIVQRLNVLFSSGTFSSQELTKTCPSLARGIDFALSTNDVPEIAHHLPSLVKQVYQRRTDASLQSAITMLMISVKNACRSRWFCSGDSDELLEMANELIDSFRTGIRIITEVSNVENTISKIIPRFYPQWKLCRLLVSFEAESLFIAQTDDLETSSCLIHPPRVSFLVNGKSVAGRTCFSQDKGPQFPTNITKMVKLGTNIIQLVGYFSGNYIISVAYMSKANDFPGSELKEHVQPALAPGDPEIIEGSSRISLNCPISLRRIQMPVKGHRCKHLQCFDYDNFLEMNSRNPSWRCPCCNQFTSFIDLRIDQNMVNILRDVTADATDVVISPDGSCKVVLDRDGSNACPPNVTLARQDDQDMGIESNNGILDVLEYSVDSTMDEDGRSNSNANAVDLTMDEEDRNNRKAYEIEDRKPFKDFQESPCLKSFPEEPLMHPANARIQGVSRLVVGDICPSTWSSTFASLGSSVFTTAVDTHRIGTLESLVPTSVLNPVITDAISPAVGREATISLSVNQQASTSQNAAITGQLGEDSQMQMPRSGNSITSIETERQPIPRQVSRMPIAVQAHLERSQACSSYQLTQPVILNSSFNNLKNSPSVSNQANIPTAASLDGLPSETVDVEASSSSGHAHSYLMNSSGSLIISHQTAPPVIVIPDGDVDMPEVSSGLDIVSPLEHHSITQKQDQGCQSSMSSAFEQAGILPSPNQVRTILTSDLQATSAYNAKQPPLSHHQIPLHQSVNVRGTTSTQSSFSPSQNAVGVPGVNLVPGGYLANYYTQLLAAQQAARMGRVPSVSPYASISGSSLPVTANNLQSMGFDQLQHTVGGSLIASEQNWRPMARMRGSLSGAAYSAALNHYLVPPFQTVPSSAYAPSSVTASEQIPMSNYKGTYVHGSFVQQANWRNSGPGS